MSATLQCSIRGHNTFSENVNTMRLVLSLILILFPALLLHSQALSLNDSSIVYKNAAGKVLTKDEVQQLAKEQFSLRQEQLNGKKIVTIYPAGRDELVATTARLDSFRNNLLGKAVIDFQLTDLDNKKWKSKELNGKVIVFNFWFTSCKPCITEMPHLNELVKDNKDKEVIFLAPAPENETQIRKFLKKYSFEYNIIPSSLDFINKLQVENFPTHLIIDQKGIVRQVFIGYADDIKEKLQKEITRLWEK